jgi:N-acetyl-1-D-myo-inositol-2-amino-2-deoxy-alpha-D-glucopyranoside deacetylase
VHDTLTLLAVHAHPDDEVICMGGTFARYAAEGLHTALVCCTRGEEGGILDPALDPAEARPRLGAIREGELRAAAAILGVAAVHMLGYRDSGLPANANPHNFVHADPAEAAERLAALVRALRPHVVVTYDEHGGYGHPDHAMAHRVTHLAIARAAHSGAGGPGWDVPKLYYTVFPRSVLRWVNERMQERGLPPPFREDNLALDIRQGIVPDEVITTRVDVRRYQEQVRRALRAHRTQIRVDDLLLALPRAIAAEAFAVDAYIRGYTRVPAPDQEMDLFAGLR